MEEGLLPMQLDMDASSPIQLPGSASAAVPPPSSQSSTAFAASLLTRTRLLSSLVAPMAARAQLTRVRARVHAWSRLLRP